VTPKKLLSGWIVSCGRLGVWCIQGDIRQKRPPADNRQKRPPADWQKALNRQHDRQQAKGPHQTT